MTVERQGMAVLLGGTTASGFNLCPFCGQKIPAAPEQARLHRHEGEASQEDAPLDGTSS
jgi:hypothetical protein